MGAVEAVPDGWHLTLGEGRIPVLRLPDPGAPAIADLPGEGIRALVARHGAILIRGLGLASPADLASAARALGVAGMAECEGFTSRLAHPDHVYSASDWPSEDQLCMHHEQSYAAVVPSIALFGCLVAPESGGTAAVADGERMMELLPEELVERFERDGWELARSYLEFGFTWAEAFGTEDRELVSDYCARNAVDCTWTEDGGLRTRQRRAAVLRHPVTGRRVWFNQAAFLHESSLDPLIREHLEELYGVEGLPFRTLYGDGETIPTDVVDTINKAYGVAGLTEPWQDGDLLMVDNLRMAHGRDPYEGDRQMVALFGDPVRVAGHQPR
ncbi:TauD/TfdA family dioxygenase [Streptomyces piniterrae]|uniref:TauD/TfdA family dioxygenase n=2 Tax=Streptomyces piniterrae TaxID=2571125 RepID=A0A4U0NKB2_9ACTN|nr:TauD/TfdA family dioxygenase [Streptomyces piniterrae]